jgi:hypothetical protein
MVQKAPRTALVMEANDFPATIPFPARFHLWTLADFSALGSSKSGRFGA